MELIRQLDNLLTRCRKQVGLVSTHSNNVLFELSLGSESGLGRVRGVHIGQIVLSVLVQIVDSNSGPEDYSVNMKIISQQKT